MLSGGAHIRSPASRMLPRKIYGASDPKGLEEKAPMSRAWAAYPRIENRPSGRWAGGFSAGIRIGELSRFVSHQRLRGLISPSGTP